MAAKQTHVVPHGDRWAYRGSGSERVSRTFRTQKDAIDAARGVSRNLHSELIVHGAKGKILWSETHGHDPCPPHDTK